MTGMFLWNSWNQLTTMTSRFETILRLLQSKEIMFLLHSISESLFLHQQKENNALNHKIDFFREKNTLFMYYFTLKVFYFYSQIQTQIMVDFLSRPALQTEHTKPNIRRSRLELQNKLISLYILLTKYFCLYPIVKNSVENYPFYLRLQTRISESVLQIVFDFP